MDVTSDSKAHPVPELLQHLDGSGGFARLLLLGQRAVHLYLQVEIRVYQFRAGQRDGRMAARQQGDDEVHK